MEIEEHVNLTDHEGHNLSQLLDVGTEFTYETRIFISLSSYYVFLVREVLIRRRSIQNVGRLGTLPIPSRMRTLSVYPVSTSFL